MPHTSVRTATCDWPHVTSEDICVIVWEVPGWQSHRRLLHGKHQRPRLTARPTHVMGSVWLVGAGTGAVVGDGVRDAAQGLVLQGLVGLDED